MYELHTEPLLPRAKFLRRLRRHGGLSVLIFLVSIALGMAGFHWLAGKLWIDAFLNSTMLLGGMGPVGDFDSPAGKIFAGFFALYAGVVFLGATTLLLAPVIHRVLHRFRLAETEPPARRRRR